MAARLEPPLSGHLVAVSWCMPPALFPRSIQVARLLKGLKRLGWTSTVVAPAVGSLGEDDPIDPLLAETYADQFVMARVSLDRVDPRRGPWLKRWAQRWRGEDALDAEQLWVGRAAAAVKRAVGAQRTHALVTFAQPWRDHLVGLAMPDRNGVPWIAHFSDPWVDSLYWSDLPAEFKENERRREAQVVEEADAVVFTNAYAAELVMQKYPPLLRSKAHVVPHTMDEALLPEVDRLTARDGAPGSGRLRMFHVGNLFAGRRTAATMFDALAAINRKRPLAGRFELVFVGAGSGLYEAREQVFVRALESIVTFRPRVGHLESLAAMRESDVLLLIDAPAATNAFLPSKVVDYLMADRPILALTPAAGPTADVVRGAGYPAIDPLDTGAVADAIEGLLRVRDAGALASAPAAAGVAKQFGLEHTSAAFAAILDRLRQGTERRR